MEKQTAGRKALGDFAPQFAALNDGVLFGEVWAKENELSPKLRSIATVSALVGKGTAGDALRYHLQTARQHGVTREEMAALLTHLAFYAGWPNAWAAFPVAKEVYADATDADGRGGFFGLGDAMFCSRKQPDAERAEELKELEELDRKREAEAEKKE